MTDPSTQQQKARERVYQAVSRVEPFDSLEAKHIHEVLAWIESGTPIFRISKPDNPYRHLVSYFILYDQLRNLLMLIDHVKAGAWLPPGGHIDPDENPRTTVVREASEELGIKAVFDTVFGNDPLFVTINTTNPPGSHEDVSLWYVISGDSTQPLAFDAREMGGYKWLPPAEVLDMHISQLDANMHRFIRKFLSRLQISPKHS